MGKWVKQSKEDSQRFERQSENFYAGAQTQEELDNLNSMQDANVLKFKNKLFRLKFQLFQTIIQTNLSIRKIFRL